MMKKVALGLALASATLAAPSDCGCNAGNYLKIVDTADRTKDVCEPNPTDTTAVENCDSYTHDGTNLKCSSCKANFYLDTTKACKANPASGEANHDANCMYYGADGKCAACNDGKWLDATDSSCKDPTATIADCKTWSSATTCSSCTDKLLDLTAGDCKDKVPATGAVADCAGYSVSGGTYTCLGCTTGKYLDTTCKDDVTAVENCDIYSTKTACGSCKDGFHLETNTCKACPDKGKAPGGNNSSSTLLSVSAAVLGFLLVLA